MSSLIPPVSIRPTLRARMESIQQRGTRLAIGLSPSLVKMPYPIQRYDDSFFPYSRIVIDSTTDMTAAYVFDLAAYLSVGASGAIALERSIAYVPETCLTVLHGAFSQPGYAALLADLAFHAESATIQLVSNADVQGLIDSFLSTTVGIFVMTDRRTAATDPDRVGRCIVNQAADSLAPDRWLTLDGSESLCWGWYGDSVALASRGEDFQESVRSAATIRRDWLIQSAAPNWQPD